MVAKYPPPTSNPTRGQIKRLTVIKDRHRVNKINIRKGLHRKRFTSKGSFSFLPKKAWATEEVLMQSILSLSVIFKEVEKYDEVSTIFFFNWKNSRSYNMLKALLHIWEIILYWKANGVMNVWELKNLIWKS